MKKIYLILIIMLCIQLMAANAQNQQRWKYDYEWVSKIVFWDPDLINQLLLDLMIPEVNVTQIEIFDIDGNGPGPGDLMRLEPSYNVYSISDYISKETRDMLASVPKDPNVGKTGITKSVSALKQKTAEDKILYIIGYTISQLYATDKPIKIYFEQFPDGTFKFNLYGYDKPSLDSTKNLAIGKVSQSKVQDLLKALYQEFSDEFMGFQPTVVKVREIIQDTLVIPIYKSK